MPILEIKSTAVLNGDEVQARDPQKASVRFTLMITGGVGEGTYLPLITLKGGTNESRKPIRLGATASVDWPKMIYVGDVETSAGAGGSQPGYEFRRDRDAVTFTYGAVQDVHLTATAQAIIDVSSLPHDQAHGLRGMPISASVLFDGIEIVDYGTVQSGDPHRPVTILLTIYPETVALAAGTTAQQG